MTGELDERAQRLKHWVQAYLADQPLVSWQPLAHDCSFRRYFRAHTSGQSWIVMDAPPQQEPIRPYLAVAAQLATMGIQVPTVHAADASQGFVLLSDFGQTVFYDRLMQYREDDAVVDGLYQQATDILLQFAHVTPSSEPSIMSPRGPEGGSGPGDLYNLPIFDRAQLEREWHLFTHWYLEHHLGKAAWIQTHRAALEDVFETMCEHVLSQPRCWMHRDFHSQNLMILADGSLGVLDFQDACWGPISYDVVALLRDARIGWPPERVEQWLLAYHARAPFADSVDVSQWVTWTDWMSVQLHLKILGIFARMALRNGQRQYLRHMALLHRYLGVTVSRCGLSILAELFDDRGDLPYDYVLEGPPGSVV